MNKKVAIVIIALALVGTVGYKGIYGGRGNEVKVEKVTLGDLADSTLYGGMVIPGEVVPVYIEAPALIETVFAREGQEVQPGDKLMVFSQKSVIENDRELRNNELDLKDIQLRIADLESGSLKLELDNRTLEIKNLEEKIKGDNRKLPVITAEARTLKDKAQAYMQLLSKDGVSATEADRAVTESNKKQVELEDLKTGMELSRQKYELMVISYESLKRELNINEAQLKSQLEKLKLNNEILVRRAEQISKPLEAPVAGVITKIDVAEGSITQSGQRLLAISTFGESAVRVEVPMYQASTIEVGQEAKVISKEAQGDKIYSGKVTRVASVAKDSLLSYGKSKEKVVEVEIKVEEKNDLKPGFQTDVEIVGRSRKEVPTVNSFSVLEENGEHYLFVVENGVAHKRKVRVGARTVSAYEILDLPLDTEIAVNPFKVRNGEKIKVVR